MKKTFEVEWETDGHDVDLPWTVQVPEEIEDQDVADYLSEKYGWLVRSLNN